MGKHAGENRYILTLLGRKLTAQQIAGATKILANQGLNIDAIRRLTGRVPLDEQKPVYVHVLNSPYVELPVTLTSFREN